MKILVTTGGTTVKIDDVRSITNFSSGAYGIKLAKALADKVTNTNDEVIVLASKDCDINGLFKPNCQTKITVLRFDTFDDYSRILLDLVENIEFDAIISAAAVSDYTFSKVDGKMSSNGDELNLKLIKTPKVLEQVYKAVHKQYKKTIPVIFGFKCLVSPSIDELDTACNKLLKYVDYIIYNDLYELRKGNQTRAVWIENGEHFVGIWHECETPAKLARKILELTKAKRYE